MSQYKKGSDLPTNSLVMFVIAALVTLSVIVVLSTGIGGIGNNAIEILPKN